MHLRMLPYLMKKLRAFFRTGQTSNEMFDDVVVCCVHRPQPTNELFLHLENIPAHVAVSTDQARASVCIGTAVCMRFTSATCSNQVEGSSFWNVSSRGLSRSRDLHIRVAANASIFLDSPASTMPKNIHRTTPPMDPGAVKPKRKTRSDKGVTKAKTSVTAKLSKETVEAIAHAADRALFSVAQAEIHVLAAKKEILRLELKSKNLDCDRARAVRKTAQLKYDTQIARVRELELVHYAQDKMVVDSE
ncbi:hypothetical protein OF83DRAFT_488525 [Amylostereum chailletii]|nr:hypothetical protein OF83DRAFT_488525 [Amylostereum chailletii]